MPITLITQLLVSFGPSAFNIIRELIQIWSKPTLTLQEVQAFCDRAQKSYNDYVNEARAAPASNLIPTVSKLPGF